jgi:uncharacterized protein YndB with AHSA1/START domain
MENTNQSYRSIEKDLFIKATPQRVFQALTEKADLERWFTKIAELDLRPGGAISFEWDRARGVYNFGKILVLEPPHRLSYTWEAMELSPVTITFTLTAKNDGTHLRLVQTGIGEGEEWDYYYKLRDNGWGVHLQHLADWLETGTCPSPGPIPRSSSRD